MPPKRRQMQMTDYAKPPIRHTELESIVIQTSQFNDGINTITNNGKTKFLNNIHLQNLKQEEVAFIYPTQLVITRYSTDFPSVDFDIIPFQISIDNVITEPIGQYSYGSGFFFVDTNISTDQHPVMSFVPDEPWPAYFLREFCYKDHLRTIDATTTEWEFSITNLADSKNTTLLDAYDFTLFCNVIYSTIARL